MKKVLIISPQLWGKIFISKHHYAEEMLHIGDLVYYLNPPKIKTRCIISKVSFESITHNQSSLNLLNYNLPYIIHRVKIKLPIIYELYIRVVIVPQINKLTQNLDEVWSFDPDFLGKLNSINSSKHLIFCADYPHWGYIKKTIKNTDLFVTISDFIYDRFKKYNTNNLLINHGLGRSFQNIKTKEKQDEKIRVAYVGNLLMTGVIDTFAIRKIIIRHQHILFNFYGPFEINIENNLGGAIHDSVSFIDFLKSQKNVVLKGVFNKKDLFTELNLHDLFIVAYNPHKDHNNLSNSHKILEYLAIGKVIVSHPVSYYLNDELKDLFSFTSEISSERLINTFKNTTDNLSFYNSYEKIEKRKQFAFENTYQKNLIKIREALYSPTITN